MKMKFNTVGLFVTDLQKTVAFYRDVMGLATDWNGNEPNAELNCGEMRLILFGRDDFETMTGRRYTYPAGLNGTMELSFDVPAFADVDVAFERVVKAGAGVVFRPMTEPWGQRTCYVSDPDGNLIEIGSFNP